MKRGALIFLLLALFPVASFGQNDEERYAEFYGDGIRAYTEARYEDALENLYRAFAVRQNPYPLKLIVRAHDFQGNCSARERAATLLQDQFPASSIPPPQRCYRTGTLHLQCPPGAKNGRIDGAFEVACGSETALPVGRHRVETGEVALNVDVRAERRTVASLPTGRTYFGTPVRARATRRDGGRPLFRQDLLEDPDMPASFRFRTD